MFVGAILACSTNLIFIGLVKSGEKLGQVEVQVGQQTFRADTDEVGYWKLNVPNTAFKEAEQIQVRAHYLNHPADAVQVNLPYLQQNDSKAAQLQLLPVTTDNLISANEQENSIVVRGQYLGPDLTAEQKIVLELNGDKFEAKLDEGRVFSAAIPAEKLIAAPVKQINASLMQQEHPIVAQQHSYAVDLSQTQANPMDIDVQPITIGTGENVEIQGKVIKPYSSWWLYFAIIVDNLAAGLAGAAFIAFLSSLTSVSFTAVQYAIFSSLMTLTPKILGGYSGTIVTNIGYPSFFLMTTLIGIPILILVVWVAKLLGEHQQQSVNKDD